MNIYNVNMKGIRFQKRPNHPKRRGKNQSRGDKMQAHPAVPKRGDDKTEPTRQQSESHFMESGVSQ